MSSSSGDSLHYVSTVFTTIGYGARTPLTPGILNTCLDLFKLYHPSCSHLFLLFLFFLLFSFFLLSLFFNCTYFLPILHFSFHLHPFPNFPFIVLLFLSLHFPFSNLYFLFFLPAIRLFKCHKI